MNGLHRKTTFALVMCSFVSLSQAQAQTPAAPASTDVYHVLFTKAAPGQATALAKQLQEQDPKDPMASHYLLLRHQSGDDWDYCVIQHLGAKASVDLTNANPNPPPTMSWHTDTFVSGPSWGEFTRAMLPAAGDAKNPSPVYVVAVHRSAPGRRTQLDEVLRQPPSDPKVPISSLVLTHLEGGPWQFLTIDRYSSWQDFATDRAATLNDEGWLKVREHSVFHHDTIADRIVPK
jgi:hypothetical protein